jgi:hypothetical protein
VTPTWRRGRTVRTGTRTIKNVTLTHVQEKMLLFFAQLRDDPCGDIRTTAALIARSLLVMDRPSRRYRPTELGREIAAALAANADH